MRTIVLDAGAFIAAERWDRKLAGFLAAAEREGATVLLPAAVVAEIWRQPPKPRSIELTSTVDEVIPLDHSRARTVGALLGKAGSTQVVDGSVAALAISSSPALVLTSDPNDIAALVKAAGVTCGIGAKTGAKAAVLIERI